MEYSDAVAILAEKKKLISQADGDIQTWISWFKGKVPSFHMYYVYNGQKKVYRERLSMKMAKQVCEDWASLLMNEKVKIVVADQEKLDKLLIDLDFWNRANESVEKGFALSMCALTINIKGLDAVVKEDGTMTITNKSKAKLELSTFTANNLIDLTWENGKCIECALIQEDTDKTTYYIHLLNQNGTYDIYKQIDYKDSEKKSELQIFHTNSELPFFVIIYPRITNNLDIDSPKPISIFGNSIDTLKAIDTKYDSYNVEFQQGKKRTYVSSKLQDVDKETGEVKNSFDPDDTVIYQLPEGTTINGENKNLVVNVTDALRSAEHSQAIQDELNFLSKQVGLGVDYYRFEKGRVMTATQVISEKSDTFRNMKKHEGILEKAIITLMKAIMYASNTFTSITFNKPEEVEIQFDDSIIEDKTTEKDNDRKDVEAGIMSKLQFRMKWYGEDEETAKKNMQDAFGDVNLTSRINAYLPALQAGAISYEEFVNQVYTELDEAKKSALVEELKSQGNIIADSLGLYNPNNNGQ